MRRVWRHEDAVVDPDALALETECLSLAQAGADDDLEEVGEGGVDASAVGEELDGLLGAPGRAFVGAGPAHGQGLGSVEGEPVVADGGAQGAGERGQAVVDGLAAAAGLELLVRIGGDVVVGELLQAHLAEHGDQLAEHVGAVAGVRGGLEQELHRLQPLGEVGGHRLVRVGVEAQLAAFKEASQRALRVPRILETAAAYGAPATAERGDIDGEGPRAVPFLGKTRTPGPELAPIRVTAPAPAVHPTPPPSRTAHVLLPPAALIP